MHGTTNQVTAGSGCAERGYRQNGAQHAGSTATVSCARYGADRRAVPCVVHGPYPVHVAVFDGSRGPNSLSGMHGELGDSEYALESVAQKFTLIW